MMLQCSAIRMNISLPGNKVKMSGMNIAIEVTENLQAIAIWHTIIRNNNIKALLINHLERCLYPIGTAGIKTDATKFLS